MPFVLNPLTGLLDRVNQLNIGEFVQGGTVGSVLFIDANGLVGESNPGLTYDGTDLTIVGDLTVNTLNYTTLNPAIDLSGRATTELDNLGTVAINTSLISDTDSIDSLGSTSIRWLNIFSDGFIGNTITLDGATGVNTLTITDNVADALSVVHGGKDFMVFDTTNSAETVTISQETRIKAGKKLVFDAP